MFDATIIVSVLFLGFAWFFTNNKKAILLFAAGAIIVAILRVSLFGVRFVLLPLYLLEIAAGIVIVLKLAGKMKKTTFRLGSIGLFAGLAASTAFFVHSFPQFSIPKPTGKFSIGAMSLQLDDTAREERYTSDAEDYRKLMIEIWYPIEKSANSALPKAHYPYEVGRAISDVLHLPQSTFSYFKLIKTDVVYGAPVAQAQAPYPVILFSPGNQSTRFQNLSLVQELVSNGYVVIGVDHPYTSSDIHYTDGTVAYRAKGDSSLLNTTGHAYQAEVEIRAQDVAFVLEQLQSHQSAYPKAQPVLQQMDFHKIGLIGHSYGGATITDVMAHNSDIKAGISYDGGLWGAAASKGINSPLLYLSASKTLDYMYSQKETDQDRKEFVSEVINNIIQMDQKSKENVSFVSFQNYDHYSFTDIPMVCPLFASGTKAMETTITVSLKFMDEYLKGKPENFMDALAGNQDAKLTEIKSLIN